MRILSKDEVKDYAIKNTLNKRESIISTLMRSIAHIEIGESILLSKKEAEKYLPLKKSKRKNTIGSTISEKLNNEKSYLRIHNMKVSCRTLINGGVMIIRIK